MSSARGSTSQPSPSASSQSPLSPLPFGDSVLLTKAINLSNKLLGQSVNQPQSKSDQALNLQRKSTSCKSNSDKKESCNRYRYRYSLVVKNKTIFQSWILTKKYFLTMFFDGKQRNSQTLFSSFLFFIRYSIHIRYRYSMTILKQSFVVLTVRDARNLPGHLF